MTFMKPVNMLLIKGWRLQDSSKLTRHYIGSIDPARNIQPPLPGRRKERSQQAADERATNNHAAD